jgi:uncharacterized protein
VQWVIKATKLCNLRCSYCYEWDHLSDPTRMSLEVWAATLRAIREYSQLAEEQLGYAVRTNIIWHGGEPLLLPVDYFESVLALQSEVFPEQWRSKRRIGNSIQTNLYSLTEEKLALLARNRFRVGVSLDFVSGVRVTKGGQETEERVLANLQRLRDHGIAFQLITVLAGHTASDLAGVYRAIHDIGVPTRLLPLFDGPSSRDLTRVHMGRRDLVDALMVVFDLWFQAGMVPQVRPFDAAVEAVVMKRLGLARAPQDRRRLANEVLVVDRDGSLSSAAQRESWTIGDLTRQSIGEILRSQEYLDNVADDVELKKSVCGPCPFLGPCDTSPLSSCFDSFIERDCVVEKPLYSRVEQYLEDRGLLGESFLRDSHATMERYIRDELLTSAPAPAVL